MMKYILIILIFCSSVFAQNEFLASVEQNSLSVGETLQLTLTFNGSVTGVSTPILPRMERLKVVGGPFTGTNVSIVPGKTVASTSFTYVLKATEPGKGIIGSAKLKYKNQEFSSAPISVQINAQGVAGQSGSSSSGGNDVFVRVIADKSEAFKGEQIVLSYKIYFAAQITSPEITKLPRATGFWIEDIPLPNQLTLNDEVINGKHYKSAVFRKMALFATSEGHLDIEPIEVHTNVEMQSKRRARDPFDIFNDPFFQLGRQTQPVDLESQKLALNIKPLPIEEVPADFDGAVGNYQVSAKLDKSIGKTNEPLTYSFRIEGIGSIKTLPAPKITFPKDIEVREPTVNDNIKRDKTPISGAKSFDYLLIPRAPGVQRIPAVSYSFFDPAKSKYISLQTIPFEVQVEKGTDTFGGSSAISIAGKRDIESVGNDIAFVKTNPSDFVPVHSQPHQRVSFWLLSSTPWILFASVLVFTRRKQAMEEGTGKYRLKKAYNKAAKELVFAEKAIQDNKTAQASTHIATSIEKAISAKFNLDNVSLTGEKLKQIWIENQLDQTLLDKIERLQKDCDFSRFASVVDKQTLLQMTQQAKEILSSLSSDSMQEVS